MQTAPLRTALTALAIAFTLSLLLLIPNPQQIRLALHESPPAQQPPTPLEVITPRLQLAHRQSAPDNPDAIAPRNQHRFPATNGVQVASASPRIVLGHSSTLDLPSPPVPAQQAPKFPEECQPTFPASSDEAPNVRVPEPAAIAPVPDPIGSVAIAPPPVPMPEPDQPVRVTRITPETEHQSPWMQRPHPSSGAARSSEPEPQFEWTGDSALSVEQGSLASPGQGITVKRSPRSDAFSFHFNAAPLPKVLEVLGHYAGWPILVTPEITGTYTGSFPDADPAQALAIVVKLHKCSVNRRGEFYLIGLRETQPR